MHTHESFSKPGLEAADDIVARLPETPRTLHPAGIRGSLAWRMLLVMISLSACGAAVYHCIDKYIETARLSYWLTVVIIIPICLFFIPWYLISSYQHRIAAFDDYKTIYQNGEPSTGSVTILTQIAGSEHDNHLIELNWKSLFSKVRVDYTFPVEGIVRTGTVYLKPHTARHLSINSEVCVLYLPNDPTRSMIFPIPGREFFNPGKIKH